MHFPAKTTNYCKLPFLATKKEKKKSGELKLTTFSVSVSVLPTQTSAEICVGPLCCC